MHKPQREAPEAQVKGTSPWSHCQPLEVMLCTWTEAHVSVLRCVTSDKWFNPEASGH